MGVDHGKHPARRGPHIGWSRQVRGKLVRQLTHPLRHARRSQLQIKDPRPAADDRQRQLPPQTFGRQPGGGLHPDAQAMIGRPAGLP